LLLHFPENLEFVATRKGSDVMATRSNRAATAANKKGRKHKEDEPRLVLVSPAFASRGEIPPRFSARGDNISPPLYWGGVPSATKELALVCEDVDSAGNEPFVHWLVYRIPPSVHELPEGIPQKEQISELASGPLQGRNSAEIVGYYGPNPPLFDDWHHYHFKLYSLDTPLRDLHPGMTRAELWEKMKSHILDETEMVGRFRRARATAA
jgi:Raf kinase inhibitor-like YbhB/YbcL family protein